MVSHLNGTGHENDILIVYRGDGWREAEVTKAIALTAAI